MGTVRLKVREGNKVQETSGTLAGDETEIGRLVERAAGGDFEAFGEIYGIYLDRIYRYILYQVKDKMTAEDLTEEVFLKAWKGLKSYRGKGKAFSSWLYRIAHNHVVDHFRSKERDSSLDTEMIAALDGPEQEVEEGIMQQELLEALSHLTPQRRRVIILKFIEGLDTSEIAQIMRKSQGAIRVMQMRALAALRVRLRGREWERSYQRS